jgi:hypothetical protein
MKMHQSVLEVPLLPVYHVQICSLELALSVPNAFVLEMSFVSMKLLEAGTKFRVLAVREVKEIVVMVHCKVCL